MDKRYFMYFTMAIMIQNNDKHSIFPWLAMMIQKPDDNVKIRGHIQQSVISMYIYIYICLHHKNQTLCYVNPHVFTWLAPSIGLGNW